MMMWKSMKNAKITTQNEEDEVKCEEGRTKCESTIVKEDLH